MSKHTPTPWTYRHNPDSLGMRYAIGIFGDKSHSSSTWVADCGHINNEAATANAQRIVACVNALEGVEDPFQFVKETKELKETYEDLLSRVIRLYRIADEDDVVYVRLREALLKHKAGILNSGKDLT